MKKAIFLTISIFATSIAFGCQCANKTGSNFLNQVKNFDTVVFGTFHIAKTEREELYFIVEKTYKGNIKKDTIELLAGGTDCFSWLDYKSGTRLVMGLVNSPYPANSGAYMANGCVTSILSVTSSNQVQTTKEFVMPAIRKQRISIFNRKMNLGKLVKRINRRV